MSEVKKGWLNKGDDLVAPFTTYDCIMDREGNRTIFQKVDEIDQKANTDLVSSYLGVDVTKKRNLWDETYELNRFYTTSGISYANGFATSYPIKVKVGKTYVASLFEKSTLAKVGKLVYATFSSATDTVAIRQVTSDTITIASGENYLRVRTYSESSSYVIANNFCMELKEGTVATDYVPYVPQMTSLNNVADYIGVDISKKRNLFDENWSIGDMNLNTGTVTSGSNLVSGFMEVVANKSYYSTGDANFYACYYDASHGYIGRTYASVLNNRQFSTIANAKYMRFLYVGTSAPSIAIFEGSEPQPYVPYRKLITDEDVLTAEEISASTSLKSTDVASASAIKSVLPSIAVGGQLNLFFVFGSVKDGSYYYSNSLFVPFPFEITASIANATVVQNGNVIYWYTSSSTLAGKGTNCIIRRLNT